MKLIDDWRQCWRLWSVRLNALGALLLGLMLSWPAPLLGLWAALPADLVAALPARAALLIPLLLNIAATVARITRQRKLHARPR